MRGVHDDLGVGHVVQGRDRAARDPDPLMDDLDDGRQAVGRAGGGGDQVVTGGLVEVVVDSHHDVEGASILDRGGHDHLPDAALEVRGE